jgi:anti-sigma regulatory factor (Ser/Thr protein kinase)
MSRALRKNSCARADGGCAPPDRAVSEPRSGSSDLGIARKVQAAMVARRLPSVEGLDMASLYIPCPSVGGDIFDIIQISDDVLVVLVFQVTGHRISSTLISAFAKVLFYHHIRSVRSPRVVIERVNTEIIRDISAEFYLTAFVGYLDLHDNTLTYSNAGHINQVVCNREKGTITHLESQGTLVGILDNGYYDERSIQLYPGDWLFLFTGGMLGLLGDSGSEETRCALDRMIRDEIRTSTPAKFVERVRTLCAGTAGTGTPHDDLSLIVLEVLTESRRCLIKEKLGFSIDMPVYIEAISYFEETDRATAMVLSAMDALGYPDEIIRKMKVSLTELLVNAIFHGNRKDYTKKVLIGHIVDSEKTVVSIMDEGAGYNPETIPDPTLPENLGKDCGRGLYIVRHYVDKIEYNGRGNRIMITKYHPYV